MAGNAVEPLHKLGKALYYSKKDVCFVHYLFIFFVQCSCSRISFRVILLCVSPFLVYKKAKRSGDTLLTVGNFFQYVTLTDAKLPGFCVDRPV